MGLQYLTFITHSVSDLELFFSVETNYHVFNPGKTNKVSPEWTLLKRLL